MARILGELDDVPQRDSQVLEQFPRRMREARRNFAAQVDGEIVNHGMKVGMRLTPIERFGELLSDLLLLCHAVSCSGEVMVAGAAAKR